MLGRALGDDRAAVVAGFRAEVDDVVGLRRDGHVVLDDDHGVAFVDEALMPLWRTLRDKLDLAAIVIVGAVGEVDGAVTFESLLARGKELLAQGRGDLDEIATQLKGEDTATIIYTSGTTGPPKGAILTHAGLLFNVRACLDIMGSKADNMPRAKQLGLVQDGGAWRSPGWTS